jgi:hypothetical protein
MKRNGIMGACLLFAITLVSCALVVPVQAGSASVRTGQVAVQAAENVQNPVSITMADASAAGCECLSEAEAKEKFGSYERCFNAACGYEPAGTVANTPVPKYFFRKASARVCPEASVCMLPDDAGKQGYVLSGDANGVCGAVAATGTNAETSYQKNMYCYKKPQAGPGCGAGSECMTEQEAKEKYGAYTIVSKASCGYGQPAASTSAAAAPRYCMRPGAAVVTPAAATKVSLVPVTAVPCRYDPGKNTCTGTCTNRARCTVTGTAMDMGTGATVSVCGCPNETCSFDYATDTCTGSCPSAAGSCQVNTMVKDSSGKTIYGECHCKEYQDQVPQVIATPFVAASSAGTQGEVSTAAAVPTELRSEKTAGAEMSGQATLINPPAGSSSDGEGAIPGNEGKGATPPTITPAVTLPQNSTGQPPDVVRSIGNLIKQFFGMQ